MRRTGKRTLWITGAVLVALSMIAGCVRVSAQTSDRVTLPAGSMTVGEVFAQVERQTNHVIVANVDKLDRDRRLTLRKMEGTVGEIMDQVVEGSGHTYTVNGRYIVIMPPRAGWSAEETPKQPAPAPVPSAGRQGLESDIEDYTRTRIGNIESRDSVIIIYDTVVTTLPHSGVFNYPGRERVPETSSIPVSTPFAMDTPPLLSVKTNLVWAATLTPNLAAEIGLGRRVSLEVAGGNNRWNLKGSEGDNRKLVHWIVKPEVRYWLCERFNGHFFGLHGFYGKYNIGGYNIPMLFDKEYRYQGDAYGAGVSYGFHWMWSRRWGAEFTAGAGVAFMDYVKKECEKCGAEVGHFKNTYVGPTSLGVKLIFVIK